MGGIDEDPDRELVHHRHVDRHRGRQFDAHEAIGSRQSRKRRRTCEEVTSSNYGSCRPSWCCFEGHTHAMSPPDGPSWPNSIDFLACLEAAGKIPEIGSASDPGYISEVPPDLTEAAYGSKADFVRLCRLT